MMLASRIAAPQVADVEQPVSGSKVAAAGERRLSRPRAIYGYAAG